MTVSRWAFLGPPVTICAAGRRCTNRRILTPMGDSGRMSPVRDAVDAVTPRARPRRRACLLPRCRGHVLRPWRVGGRRARGHPGGPCCRGCRGCRGPGSLRHHAGGPRPVHGFLRDRRLRDSPAWRRIPTRASGQSDRCGGGRYPDRGWRHVARRDWSRQVASRTARHRRAHGRPGESRRPSPCGPAPEPLSRVTAPRRPAGREPRHRDRRDQVLGTTLDGEGPGGP